MHTAESMLQHFSATGTKGSTTHMLHSTDPTVCISVSDHVSEKFRKQIVEDRFIELYALLPGSLPNDDIQINVQGGSDAVLRLSSKSKPKELSINTWLKAFHIFMDIYVKKHPESVSGLLCYISLVRELEQIYGHRAFSFYDTMFRQQREVRAILGALCTRNCGCGPLLSSLALHRLQNLTHPMCSQGSRGSAMLTIAVRDALRQTANIRIRAQTCGAAHQRYRCSIPNPQQRSFPQPTDRQIVHSDSQSVNRQIVNPDSRPVNNARQTPGMQYKAPNYSQSFRQPFLTPESSKFEVNASKLHSVLDGYDEHDKKISFLWVFTWVSHPLHW